jgi:hypothetical protein
MLVTPAGTVYVPEEVKNVHVLPPEAAGEPKDKTPEPSVCRNCPLVPSADGRVSVRFDVILFGAFNAT